MDSVFSKLQKGGVQITTTPSELLFYNDLEKRRLRLFGQIPSNSKIDEFDPDQTITQELVWQILRYNSDDKDKKPEDRQPIVLYIDSPGGDITEGFSLISTIKASKTPVWTVNIGEWSSMGFLIGIAGKRRFSLKHVTFLMHDGSFFTYDSGSKAQDRAKFNERFQKEIIKKHVLECTKINEALYEQRLREEWYMLASDAKEYGVIDEIVETLDEIV